MFAARPLRLTAVRGLLAVPMLLASGTMVSRGQPASPPGPPAGATGPMRVTTDTPEYCVELSERVIHAERAAPAAGAMTAPAPPHQTEVDQLAAEGQHMCAVGLIRGGLLRLRRALMLLRAGQ